ncbi:MAG: xanthine dehydrogenase small subunit [Oligoflexus sp.]
MASPTRDFALLYINGQRHEIRGSEAFLMLADYLRDTRGLTGTKIVCAEGDCGACTVLRAYPRLRGRMEFEAINSCVITMAQLDGSHLVTVEGLAQEGQLSPIQEAVVQCHGTQCGYCTPGFAMAMTGLFQRPRPQLSSQLVKNHLTGNLCRCTGYSSLIDAALSIDSQQVPSLNERYLPKTLVKETQKTLQLPLHIKTADRQFMAPVDIKGAVQMRRRFTDARLISAATDVGVQINKGKAAPKQWLSLHLIPELYTISSKQGRVHVGARVSLAALRRYLEKKLPELANFIDIFASPQIKSVATLIGNIANASPIGDTLPFMLVADGLVHVVGGRKPRDIPMSELYTGYRQLALKAGEWISHASFRLPTKAESLRLYKVSQRKDLDIATVNCAFLFQLGKKKGSTEPFVKAARLAFGGMGPTVLRCEEAEAFLADKSLTDETMEEALHLMQQQLSPLSDLRGSAAYRRVLVESLFRKYCQELRQGRQNHAEP